MNRPALARKYVICPQCEGEGFVVRVEKELPDNLKAGPNEKGSYKVHAKCPRCMGTGKVKGPSHVSA